MVKSEVAGLDSPKSLVPKCELQTATVMKRRLLYQRFDQIQRLELAETEFCFVVTTENQKTISFPGFFGGPFSSLVPYKPHTNPNQTNAPNPATVGLTADMPLNTGHVQVGFCLRVHRRENLCIKAARERPRKV